MYVKSGLKIHIGPPSHQAWLARAGVCQNIFNFASVPLLACENVPQYSELAS